MGKAEAAPDRFAIPKACCISSPSGTARLGLPDKSGKRPIKHAFEQDVALRNVATEDARSTPPGGKRFLAGQDYMERLDEHKQSYDDWKRPNKPAFKETLTSLDNPLRTAANDPSDLPFYKDRGIEAAQVEEEQTPKGKRCFARNVNYGMMEQLAPGTLRPLTGQEMRDERREALRDFAATVVSPSKHTKTRAERQQRDAGDSPGPDLLVSAEGGDAEGQQPAGQKPPEHAGGGQDRVDDMCSEGGSEDLAIEDLSSFPTVDEQELEQAKIAIFNKAAEELVAQQALEDQLIREWPHGAPKHLLLKLAQDRKLPSALSVPSLGFGFPCSLSSKLAAATLRE